MRSRLCCSRRLGRSAPGQPPGNRSADRHYSIGSYASPGLADVPNLIRAMALPPPRSSRARLDHLRRRAAVLEDEHAGADRTALIEVDDVFREHADAAG